MQPVSGLAARGQRRPERNGPTRMYVLLQMPLRIMRDNVTLVMDAFAERTVAELQKTGHQGGSKETPAGDALAAKDKQWRCMCPPCRGFLVRSKTGITRGPHLDKAATRSASDAHLSHRFLGQHFPCDDLLPMRKEVEGRLSRKGARLWQIIERNCI